MSPSPAQRAGVTTAPRRPRPGGPPTAPGRAARAGPAGVAWCRTLPCSTPRRRQRGRPCPPRSPCPPPSRALHGGPVSWALLQLPDEAVLLCGLFLIRLVRNWPTCLLLRTDHGARISSQILRVDVLRTPLFLILLSFLFCVPFGRKSTNLSCERSLRPECPPGVAGRPGRGQVPLRP